MWLWRAALAVALLGGGGAQDALVTEGLAVTLLGGGPPPDRPVVRGLACGSRLVGRYISDFSACRASILQATGADLRLDSTSYFAFGGIYGTCVACTELEFRYALDNRDEFASGFSVGTFDVYSVGPRPPAPMPPPAPLSPPPVSLEPVTVFTYVGCYKDSWHARDLATPADSARPSTIESCGEACGALGALFFGLQAGPCSCGDDVGTDPRAHEKLNDAECGAPCPGDEGAQPTSMPKGAARQPLDAPRPCGAKGRNAAYRINVISAPSSPPPPAKPCLDNDETFTKLSHGFSCAQSTSHCLEGTMGWNIVRKLCPLSCTVALRRGCKDEKGEQHEKVEWTAPGCAEVAEAIESGAPIPGVLPPSAPSHSAPAKPAAPARPSRGSRASESSSSPSPAAPAPSPADSEVEPAKRPRGRHPSPAPPPPAPPPAAPPRPERSGATRRHGSDGDGDGDGGKGRHPAAAAATAPVRAEHPARLRAGARGQQRHVGWVGCYSVAKSELRASVGLGLGTSGCARSCSAFPYFAMQVVCITRCAHTLLGMVTTTTTTTTITTTKFIIIIIIGIVIVIMMC
ncbi:hypothetical protein T492DRAFT_91181 [Pavlovales sp. CCMP2436]|nr:hypothetical protein T492DRAFT_91181 [Pavlovales sp. CCMP2436]